MVEYEEIFQPEKVCGIIGHPLGHSLSPALHNWAFTRAGLPMVYMRWDLAPEGLAEVMAAARRLPIWGLSVTIPHKEVVGAHLDAVSPTAREAGAVNTCFWRKGKFLGENTDVEGFVSPLKALSAEFDAAMVLGAGGAARAVLAGLKSLGVTDVRLCNRNPERARRLGEEFGVHVVDWEQRTDIGTDLVVNATPLGMRGDQENATAMPADAWKPSAVAYDLVYNPLETRFLTEAGQAGCRTVDGLEMFLGQGAAQFRLWTGKEMDRDAARTLLESLLTG
jgi:shikimate dehydrogenase